MLLSPSCRALGLGLWVPSTNPWAACEWVSQGHRYEAFEGVSTVNPTSRRQFLGVMGSAVGAAVVGWPSRADAQSSFPVISGMNGTLAHGNAVTIEGSALGTKAAAAPLIFDQMTTGAFSPLWAGTGYDYNTGRSPFTFVTSNPRHTRNNSWSAYANINREMLASLSGGSNSQTWFCQYWLRLGSNWAWNSDINLSLGNVKFFRIWSTRGNAIENFVMAFHGANGAIFDVEGVGQWHGSEWPTRTRDLSVGNWHCLQFAYQDSSAVGAANGSITVWCDGAVKISYNNLITRGSESDFKRPAILGFYNSHSSGGKDSDFQIADPYIDNTWARVELGNASTYAACTRREIQRTSSWTPSAVGFTVNLGGFGDAGMAYLYLTDGSGRTSGGYPVTLGGNGQLLPPRAPTGVTIIK